MSSKHRASPVRTTGRALSGFVLGSVVTVLAVIVLRSCSTTTTHSAAATAGAAAPTSTPAVARADVLAGTYDVTVHVNSVQYGSTWSTTPVLAAGQDVTQVWTVRCEGDACAIHIDSGHVVEDAAEAVVRRVSDSQWSVQGTTPPASDQAGQPPGCGTVQATDVQRLALGLSGASLHGQYVVHRPTLHAEGAGGGGRRSGGARACGVSGWRPPRRRPRGARSAAAWHRATASTSPPRPPPPAAEPQANVTFHDKMQSGLAASGAVYTPCAPDCVVD